MDLGDASKEIMEANSPGEIDALRLKKVKVVIHDGNDFITQEVKLISDEIRSMANNICYMAVYGHKSIFESEVREGISGLTCCIQRIFSQGCQGI